MTTTNHDHDPWKWPSRKMWSAGWDRRKRKRRCTQHNKIPHTMHHTHHTCSPSNLCCGYGPRNSQWPLTSRFFLFHDTTLVCYTWSRNVTPRHSTSPLSDWCYTIAGCPLTCLERLVLTNSAHTHVGRTPTSLGAFATWDPVAWNFTHDYYVVFSWPELFRALSLGTIYAWGSHGGIMGNWQKCTA